LPKRSSWFCQVLDAKEIVQAIKQQNDATTQ